MASTPTTISPNVKNLQVGKGIVSFKKEGDSTFRDLGNCTQFTVTPETDTLEHFTSREGIKKRDLIIILQQKAQVKIIMEELTPDNFSMMVQGDVDDAAMGGPEVEIFGGDAVTGEVQFVGTNDVGPRITINLYNVSFLPSGDINMISDEFNNLEVTGDVLIAASGPNVGKFGLAKFTNTVEGS